MTQSAEDPAKSNFQAPSVSRVSYAAWGFGLMLFKYAVEYLLVINAGGSGFPVWAFVIPFHTTKTQAIVGAEPWVGWFILAWSLPFVFVAIYLTIGRCLDAGVSVWNCLWMLCPGVNLGLMLLMCVLPPQPSNDHDQTSDNAASQKKRNLEQDTPLWLATILMSLLLTTGMLLISIYFLGDYGTSIFFSAPILLGTICGFAQTRHGKEKSLGAAIGIAASAALIGCCSLIVLGLEGLVCIVMAMPIMLPAAIVGGIIGYCIARCTMSNPSWLSAAMVLPSVAMIGHFIDKPIQYEVVSVVDVDASPIEVWDTVVAFPDIVSDPDWLSQMGVAYPIRARIEGTGVDAVRYCEFSTGDFVEPITVWDCPNRLAFDVEDQPCPLTELSPWQEIHPPHLDGFMRSQRGEFRLIELPDGGTRLEGHTWYSVDMYPQLYWKIWTDKIIHSIHGRVLDHIKNTVETKRYEASGETAER